MIRFSLSHGNPILIEHFIVWFMLYVFFVCYYYYYYYFSDQESLSFKFQINSHSLKHLICYIRYIATIDGLVHKRHLIAISEGTTVEGVLCVPDVVELLPRQPEMQRTRIRIVVIYLF